MECLDQISDYLTSFLPVDCEEELTSKKDTLKQIRKQYLEEPTLELERLRNAEILNWDKEVFLDEAILPLTSNFNKKTELKIMIGRALEVQKIYQETHHVFIHAQASRGIIFPSLVKEFMKSQHRDQDFDGFEFLRLPNSSTTPSITAYSNAFNVFDHEEKTRDDLISADAYFYHNESYESSLHFLSLNKNIMGIASPLIAKAIRYFHPNLSEKSRGIFARRIVSETDEDPSHIGNLFVFCIPKEKSGEIQYRAHPFGKACHCHKENDSTEILEKLQAGILDEETMCNDLWNWNACPQFRLFTPALTQENGVNVHLLPSNQSYQEKVEQKVHDIVLELKARQRFAPVLQELLSVKNAYIEAERLSS